MAQVKVYGLKENLAKNKAVLSEIIHGSLVSVLGPITQILLGDQGQNRG